MFCSIAELDFHISLCPLTKVFLNNYTNICEILNIHSNQCQEGCFELLYEYNALVVPGTAFGDSGEGYIRISYAASQEKLKALIADLSKMIS